MERREGGRESRVPPPLVSHLLPQDPRRPATSLLLRRLPIGWNLQNTVHTCLRLVTALLAVADDHPECDQTDGDDRRGNDELFCPYRDHRKPLHMRPTISMRRSAFISSHMALTLQVDRGFLSYDIVSPDCAATLGEGRGPQPRLFGVGAPADPARWEANGRVGPASLGTSLSAPARSASGRSMISSSSPAAADLSPTERDAYVTCTVRGLLLRTTLRGQPRGDLAPLGEGALNELPLDLPLAGDAPRLSIPPASDRARASGGTPPPREDSRSRDRREHRCGARTSGASGARPGPVQASTKDRWMASCSTSCATRLRHSPSPRGRTLSRSGSVSDTPQSR